MAKLDKDMRKIVVPAVVVLAIILIFAVIIETRPNFEEIKAEQQQKKMQQQ